MTTQPKKVTGWSDFFGSPIVFKVSHTEIAWHRTDKYPDRCSCGVDPSASNPSVVRRIVEPTDEWKWSDSVGTCLDPNQSADPHKYKVGDRVSIAESAGSLFEQTHQDDDWFIEEFGTRKDDDAPIVKIVNRRNAFYTWAPISWLKDYEPPSLKQSRTLVQLLAIADPIGLADSIVAASDLMIHAPGQDVSKALVRLATWVHKNFPNDWTAKDGRINSSLVFSELRTRIAEVLRSSAHTIASEGLNRSSDDIANAILHTLAHHHHMRPVKP